ncbi:MAG: metal ABC transporter permease [bacterium]
MFMIALWHQTLAALPFEWAGYAFMRNALLAVLLICPLYALLGVLIIHKRMTFFSDAIGHSALTGIAIGIVAGMGSPLAAMVIFSVALAIGITVFQWWTRASADMLISVFMSFAMALGIVILARQGGFAKYSRYLIGDFLSVGPEEIAKAGGLFVFVGILIGAFFNHFLLTGANESLARSRGVRSRWVQIVFAVTVAVVVAVSIPWVGLLVINALLVLPAASARNISSNTTRYVWLAVVFSLLSGVCGLIFSYYLSAPTGATMVLFAMLFFVAAFCLRSALIFGFLRRQV